MNILAPSVLGADFARLGEQIRETRDGGAAYLHLDVMDGVFVPSISFGMPVIAALLASLFFEKIFQRHAPEPDPEGSEHREG